MTGRLIVTGQVVVDIVLRIPALPPPGGDVFATEHFFAPGGDYLVMVAAARDGAEVVYTGGHGTGQFSELARAAMAGQGIRWVAAPGAIDTGFSVTMVDATAERTFVSVRGAECVAGPADLRAADVADDDIVLISGYSLLDAAKSAVLVAALPELPARTRLAFDPGPLVAEIPAPALRAVLARTDLWTGNAAEAHQVWAGGRISPATVGLRPGGVIVVRAGAHGCAVHRTDGRGANTAVAIPGFSVSAVSSNGAGDTHTGVLLATLLAGAAVESAARRANAAAAIAVSRFGPEAAPISTEIDRLLPR